MGGKRLVVFLILGLVFISLLSSFSLAAEEYSYEIAEELTPLIEWRDYGPDAFVEATLQEKPIFLLLTAPSWCYWCQVYESEDYLFNSQIVSLINSEFIPVYVDADKRQDLTRQYLEGGTEFPLLDLSEQRRQGHPQDPGGSAAIDRKLEPGGGSQGNALDAGGRGTPSQSQDGENPSQGGTGIGPAPGGRTCSNGEPCHRIRRLVLTPGAGAAWQPIVQGGHLPDMCFGRESS